MGLLEQCETQAERKMIYTSIGSCPTAAMKSQVLEWTVSSVKLQDFFYPLNRQDLEEAGRGERGVGGLGRIYNIFDSSLFFCRAISG